MENPGRTQLHHHADHLPDLISDHWAAAAVPWRNRAITGDLREPHRAAASP